MATRRPPPAPPTEAGAYRRARWPWIALVAVIGAAGAGWFLARDADTGGLGSLDRPGSEPAPRAPSAVEVSDPQESRRLAEIEEQRGRYESLRMAFAGAGAMSRAATVRLEPALRALWPAGSVAWTVACKSELCQVDGPAPAAAWQAQLVADPAVRSLTDRVAVDPDGKGTAAYMLLVVPGAAPGASVLDEVEEDFRKSNEARECLSGVGATGRVEYVLQVDVSGYTFRQDTDLPLSVLDCVDRVLTEILDRHPPPKSVRTASRTFSLRR